MYHMLATQVRSEFNQQAKRKPVRLPQCCLSITFFQTKDIDKDMAKQLVEFAESDLCYNPSRQASWLALGEVYSRLHV
jgi:hypothetical protein